MIYIYNYTYIYTYSFILEVSGDLLTRNRADPPTIFDDPRDVIYDALYNTIYIYIRLELVYIHSYTHSLNTYVYINVFHGQIRW